MAGRQQIRLGGGIGKEKMMKTCFLAIGLIVGASASLSGAEPWTLDQAVRYALSNSPDARLAAQRIVAAQAGLDQAKAAFSPQLQFGSSYVRSDNPMVAFGEILNQRSFSPSLDFNSVPDTDNVNVKGLLTVPLYAGGRNVAGRDAAKANTEAAKRNAEAVRNALAFEVARVFHTVLKTREFIKATETGVRAFETNVAVAQRRVSAGTLLKADELEVEVRLAQAREDLVRARNAWALATRALRNLLGIDQGEFEVADAAPAGSVPGAGGVAGRAELAASRFHQQTAEAELRGAGSGYKPRLSAFGSLDYDYGPRTTGDGGSYTVGALLQWEVWDGLLTKAKREEAKAKLESAREEDRKLRLALDLELEQARIALRDATERLAVTEKSVDQARESAELIRSRFDQGLAISTQLVNAETALTGARVRWAEAESDRRIAIAAVRKALGLSQLETSTAK
jgi:outer membrane protein